MSQKRRRAVNVDTGIIDALKTRAKQLGIKSHSALATMIFDGGKPSISLVEYSGKSVGISMREALWLSLKCRADALGVSNVEASRSILIGTAPPLEEKEISRGEELAAEREKERAADALINPPKKKPSKPRKKRASKKVETKPEIAAPIYDSSQETREEAEGRIRRQAKLSNGTPIDNAESISDRSPKKINPESNDEYLGGVYSL